ncbi:MAG: tetratricopeptide repeat protein [Chloroflexi bacterium]|nr:tetratricopeptide repeat protein [Chloroflexota bacterium]
MRRLLEPFYPNQKLPDDPQGLKGLYQQTFASAKALLLLDNAADETQVRPLIPPQPSAAIVTSRKHFSLSELGLNPLRLDVLSPEEARGLLRNASPKLKDAPDADLDALASLCGRLPLALRVASSLLNDRDDWTLAALQKRLTDERTRLARLKRGGDLDVEATLSLSYNLLDDDLKKKFRQLGVFTAPFILPSAQAVWELDDDTAADDLLGKFTNLSLINILPSPASGRGVGGEGALYSLHDLTRLFAMDKLLEDPAEAKATVMRHANHFLEWGSAANNLYMKGNEKILAGLNHFRFIYPHLQSAYVRLSPENKTFPRPEGADRWLSDFPAKCAYVLDLHLPPRQNIHLLKTTLAAARRLGDKKYEGIHLGNLGLAYFALGDAKKAIEFYEQGLVIDREIGDRRGEGADLGNLGLAYAALGDAKKAIEYHEKALVVMQEIGDKRAEGSILGNLGLAYSDLGDAKKAIEFYEQGLVIAREIGDRRGEGAALGNLGAAYADLGDAKKAIEFYEKQLVIVREIGDRRGEGNALGNLSNANAYLGDAKKAIEFYEKRMEIAREIGDRRGEGNALGNLGVAYKNLGDAKKAIEFYEGALVIDREIGDRRGEGADLGNLGLAYADLGDAKKAIEFYEKRMEIAREIGDRRGEGNALGNLGSAYFTLKEYSKAGEFYEQQMAIVRDIGDKRGEGNALWGLAICKKEGGNLDEARILFLKALEIFKAIESPSAGTIEKLLAGLGE